MKSLKKWVDQYCIGNISIITMKSFLYADLSLRRQSNTDYREDFCYIVIWVQKCKKRDRESDREIERGREKIQKWEGERERETEENEKRKIDK